MKVHLSDGSHAPRGHVAYGSERGAEAGEEEREEGEKLGSESGVECRSDHLQDLQAVYYCLG